MYFVCIPEQMVFSWIGKRRGGNSSSGEGWWNIQGGSAEVFSFLKKIVFCLPFLASKALCKSVVDKLAVNSSRLYIWTTGNFIGWVIEKIEVFVETTCSLSRAGNIFSIILSCGISRHSQDKGGIGEGMGNLHIDTIHKQIKIFDN